MMIQKLRHLSGMAFGAALAATVLAHGVAAAAPLAPTTCQNASIVVSGGKAQPACVSQDGNTLVIVLNGAGQSTPEPDMSAVTDPRIDSYAKRQAIRDQYRGHIDEVTFNDELGDGVSLARQPSRTRPERSWAPRRSAASTHAA